MSFNIDLARGKEVELKALEILRKYYPCATVIDAFKGYDIWLPERHKSVEVKYDPMSNETGNIVIEIEMNGALSALMTTTADYWLFHDDHKWVIMQPMQIVRCIFMGKYKYVEFVGEGDVSNKKAFLVKKESLFKYGKELK